MKEHLIPALAALLEKNEDVAVVVRKEIAEPVRFPVVHDCIDHVPSGQDRRRERRAKERKNKRK